MHDPHVNEVVEDSCSLDSNIMNMYMSWLTTFAVSRMEEWNFWGKSSWDPWRRDVGKRTWDFYTLEIFSWEVKWDRNAQGEKEPEKMANSPQNKGKLGEAVKDSNKGRPHGRGSRRSARGRLRSSRARSGGAHAGDRSPWGVVPGLPFFDRVNYEWGEQENLTKNFFEIENQEYLSFWLDSWPREKTNILTT